MLMSLDWKMKTSWLSGNGRNVLAVLLSPVTEEQRGSSHDTSMRSLGASTVIAPPKRLRVTDIARLLMHVTTLLLFVVYSYFLYRNKQTSAKTRWAFEVITPPPQGGIYISKIKSNSRSEV